MNENTQEYWISKFEEYGFEFMTRPSYGDSYPAYDKSGNLLKTSDWTQLSDSPINKTLWASYRDELRNLPQNFSDPDLVVWPTPPFLG